ncbi:transglutaminase TgpA family protein [Amycolatopsis alba]|uniref:Transglutaminase n=1 Tax=Amycolatopsis alba DSM 44262 TaxID=1125972 RepID=A0A229RG39_AMYAL|nr:transglutaminaseTgpA domain-containing protein [Amycolatopsis alba]OXM45617.1 transglutaminase [Amycolatopsis alba DSM 44262]
MSAGFDRIAVAGLLGATGAAGLLFAPVFGWGPLLVPVLVVVLVGYGCAELTAKFPKLVPYRPLLVAFLGLLGLIETVLSSTTLAFLPTLASLQGVARGLTEGWQLTLQSTWPARPVPDQLLFVPLSVLLAVVLGLELLLRLKKPLVALAPSLVVAGLAQAYQALTGIGAVAAALGYTLPAGLVLWSGRRVRAVSRTPGGAWFSWRLTGSAVWPALSTVAALIAGSVAFAGLDPIGQEPLTLKDTQAAPPPRNRLGNPLDDIAHRLTQPGEEVFRYRSDTPVDQWRLIVLNGFDGANWLSDSRLQRLGTGLDGALGGASGTAELKVRGLAGPWLPSHQDLTGVDGVTPLVDQAAGTLLMESPSPGPERHYRLSWSSPDVDLGPREVDAQAPGGLGGLGTVPPEVEQLAKDAVRGLRPTFQSALQLERFLSTNYLLAAGSDELPTGHGWPQLRHFLLESKRGTSEQFAAAYVVLARMSGIPARLVVGFRGSAETDGGMRVVRNRDVLAWPEVAVAGAGWVPLDPTAAAGKSGQEQAASGKAVARARAQLPAEQQLRPPQLPPGTPADTAEGQNADAGASWWWLATAALIVLLGLLWLLGVPVAKVVRARRRRRRSGAEGVLGAWDEIRDRLRAHGVPFRIGMTPRDLAESAGSLAGEGIREPVARLAKVLDVTLWSGVPVGDGAVRRAWQEVGEVRRGLATRPFAARVLAALEPRTLVPIKGRSGKRG